MTERGATTNPLSLAIALSLGLGLALGSAPLRAESEPALPIQPIDRIHLDDVEVGRGGTGAVEIALRAFTAANEPAILVPPWSFEVREDGRAIDGQRVSVRSFSDVDDRPIACVLVIDVTPTMTDAIANIRESAMRAIEELRPGDSLAIVTVAERPVLLAGFDTSTAQKRALLSALRIEDTLYGRLFDGIELALRTLDAPALPRRRFAIVFSDGEDSSSATPRADLIARSQATDSRPQIPLFTVGHASSDFDVQTFTDLKALARETNGEFREADRTLESAIADIWRRHVRQSYLVSFDARMDGREHQLEIVADGDPSREPPSVVRRVRYSEPALGPHALLAALAALVVVVGIAAWLVARRGRPGELVVAGRAHFSLERGPNQIGAIADNDIVLDDPTVSRWHATIHVHGRSVEIEDRDSLNGTFVNGEPVRSAPLRPGDRLRLGELQMEYRR